MVLERIKIERGEKELIGLTEVELAKVEGNKPVVVEGKNIQNELLKELDSFLKF